MKLTYKQLAAKILALPVERQNDDVAIFVGDECYGNGNIETGTCNDSDVLDDGHFFLAIKE